MSDDGKMRDRLREFVFRRWGLTEKMHAGDPVCSTDDVCAFAASERALERSELLARASEGAAPEFARAEQSLRDHADDVGYELAIHPANIRALLGELDRRAAVAAAQAAELEELRAKIATNDRNIEAIAERLGVAPGFAFIRNAIEKLMQRQPQSADRATRELWHLGKSADSVLYDKCGDDPESPCSDREDAFDQAGDGERVYRVTITAERVEGSDKK